MTDSRAVHDAVARLYGAVLAPAEWPAALKFVIELLCAHHAIVLALGADADDPFVASAGVDPALTAKFCTPEAMRMADPWVCRLLPDKAMSSADVIADHDLEATAYYNELIRPANGFYSVCASLDVPGRAGTFMSFCRSRRAGAFDAAGAATLQVILPHFTTALELFGRLRRAQNKNDSLLQVLDHLDSGVVLVDTAAQPHIVNNRAMRIMAEADGLMFGPSGLSAATPAATQLLRQAIAGVASPEAGHGKTHLRLERPSGRPPLLLSLFPIWRLGVAASQRLVAIFITEPDFCAPLDRAAMADAFRLTPREAALVALLADGHDLKSAAQALAIGIGTARNHLKQVFEKTDTHSQVTLLAALRGFVHRRN